MKGNVVIQQSFRPLTPPYKIYFKEGQRRKDASEALLDALYKMYYKGRGRRGNRRFPYWEGPYPTSKGMRP
jgi:hypothetical protein